ncbi:MAG TPA: PLD nuclease N-terminal domain-containing protein [Sunxiuqinia sp.]|nr:PLD nuclease N-terminal domain-containing protein [Sunxiuqinia sp.]
MKDNPTHLNDKHRPCLFVKFIIPLFFFSLFFLQGCDVDHPSTEITFQHFENELLENHAVEKVVVVNHDIAEVYLKKDQLNQPQNKDMPEDGPQYYFKIGTIASFERQMDEARQSIPRNENLEIVYENRKHFLSGLVMYSLPLAIILIAAVLFILWIIVLIDVLRSEFKHSIDKLVWVNVVGFIPLLGMILYLAIGRKQKINTNEN